jgi:hypothetical protein
MQNNTKKMGHRTGTSNEEGHKAGGIRKGAGMGETSKLEAWAAFNQ